MKLVIFDLDGTLLDTGRGIVKSVAFSLKKMGLSVPSEGVCKSFVGPPFRKRFLELFDTDEKTADAALTVFREEYGKGDVFLADRYLGMEECLAALREHFSLAVATNKSEIHAIALLEKFDLAHFFDVICGSDMAASMSKEQIVAKAANQLGVPHKDCIVVGDSDNDAIAASKLSIPFIGVTYGYGFKNPVDIERFPHIGCADSPLKITEFIAEKCKNCKNPL